MDSRVCASASDGRSTTSVDHVLGSFDREERRDVPAIVSAAADAVDLWLDDGLDAAMRFANTWEAPATDSR